MINQQYELDGHYCHGERDLDLKSALFKITCPDFSVVKFYGALCDCESKSNAARPAFSRTIWSEIECHAGL